MTQMTHISLPALFPDNCDFATVGRPRLVGNVNFDAAEHRREAPEIVR